jgi:hypothetical protein
MFRYFHRDLRATAGSAMRGWQRYVVRLFGFRSGSSFCDLMLPAEWRLRDIGSQLQDRMIQEAIQPIPH